MVKTSSIMAISPLFPHRQSFDSNSNWFEALLSQSPKIEQPHAPHRRERGELRSRETCELTRLRVLSVCVREREREKWEECWLPEGPRQVGMERSLSLGSFWFLFSFSLSPKLPRNPLPFVGVVHQAPVVVHSRIYHLFGSPDKNIE